MKKYAGTGLADDLVDHAVSIIHQIVQHANLPCLCGAVVVGEAVVHQVGVGGTVGVGCDCPMVGVSGGGCDCSPAGASVDGCAQADSRRVKESKIPSSFFMAVIR